MVRTLLLSLLLAATTATVDGKEQQPEPDWWLTPHRLVQTNLREIDATMDIDQYVREVQEFGANVVLFNVGGISATDDCLRIPRRQPLGVC